MATSSVTSSHLRIVGFLLDLFFDPEDEGDIVLRNIGGLLTNYTALQSRKSHSSYTPLGENQILQYFFFFVFL
jgi:hypothetical protein